MNRRFALSVLPLLALLGCEPVEGDPGGLAAFEGGVLQQARLDGDPVPGAGSAASATPPAEAAAPTPPLPGGLETVGSEPAPGLDWGTTPPTGAPPEAEEGAEVDVVAAADPGVEGGESDPVPAELEDDATDPTGGLGAEGAAAAAVKAGSGDAVAPDDEPVEAAEPGGDEAGSGDPAGGAEAAEPPAVEDVLPDPPPSDSDALAALDAIAKAPAAKAALPAPQPCAPSDVFLNTPLRRLVLVQTWEEGGRTRAMVKAPDGTTRRVGAGDLLGETGARVVSIGLGELLLAEIQFDMEGRPVLVQQRLRQPAPPAE